MQLVAFVQNTEETTVAQILHARKRGKDYTFRLWRTTTDSYETRPITKKQLKDLLLLFAIMDELLEEELTLPERIENATKNGTESECDFDQTIDGPWLKSRCNPQWNKKRLEYARSRLTKLLKNLDKIAKL